MPTAAEIAAARRKLKQEQDDWAAECANREPPDPHKPPREYTRPPPRLKKALEEDHQDLDADGKIEGEEEAALIITIEQLEEVERLLEGMILDMRAVCWSYRSFFLSEIEWVPIVREFQLEVLHEAETYKEGLLPLSKVIICHVKRFFVEYETDFPTWKKRLPLTDKFAKEIGDLLNFLADWYTGMAADLKKRLGKAEEVLGALIVENKNYRKVMMVMKMKWTVIDPILCPLVFVCEVGSNAAPFAIAGGTRTSAYSKEVEFKQPGDAAILASHVLEETLIPVLERFARRARAVASLLLRLNGRLKEMQLTPQELAEVNKKTVDIDPNGLKAKKKGKEEPPPEPETPKLSDEELEFLNNKRKCHYDWMVLMSTRIYHWCDETISLEPLFNYDLEFVPSYKLRDKEYVEDWMENQCSADGTNCASTVRDITKNAEILLALPG
eukprot:TRINITY_DN6990_c2_g1_i4.p1 TRINITY_DN6990_c2_g1~~TRINITY_DN6990_c2_g1_i4.p1  ORF type:complete len:441 (+),score=141.42 TRINITY_DN6990_c2_g1_i4:62-1384(+)